MIYPELSEEAAAAAADAVRAWSDVLHAWSAMATSTGPDGALEHWNALVRAGAQAQHASARAAMLAGSGAHFANSPFGVTGLFASAPPPARDPRAPAASTVSEEGRRGFQSLAKPLGRADDLTRIKGVGAKMQEKLNALGVFHFWQLASLSPAAAKLLDSKLGAGGRIARDAWVAQAQVLADEVEA